MLSDRLGTARLQDGREVVSNYPFEAGKFWLGRGEDGAALGYRDDRHICLVAGTRGGKGASIIINNLCLWPGSAVVIDPKGENASVTAARRGQGEYTYDDEGDVADTHCNGMGQAVHVLDPFNVATVDDCYRSSFNPLAGLDIEDEETLEEAHRIANALVIVHDDTKDGPWDEQARTLVRGLILHVLSADRFQDSQRNLPTVAELVQCGDQLLAETFRAALPDDKQIDQPHLLLFKDMQRNPAFGGRVARIGSQFRTMLENSAKQFQGVLQSATANTEFLDSPGMMRVLSGEGRTFKLSDLKTDPRGVTVYLSLPLRQLRNTHFRWLRMMIDLITTQMEITRGKPATGHPLLMFLDEFRALQRMDTLQAAAPYIAGFGIKLAFVVQTLGQLHEVYKDGWETFLGNAGLKFFFSIEDNFTRDYVSKHIGVMELRRELRSVNQSEAENESEARGTSKTHTVNSSTTRSEGRAETEGQTVSESDSVNRGRNVSQSRGENVSRNAGRNWSVNEGETETEGEGENWSENSSTQTGYNSSRNRSSGAGRSSPGSLNGLAGYSFNSSQGAAEGFTTGSSNGTGHGTSRNTSRGRSRGAGQGGSEGLSVGQSLSFTAGLSYGETHSDSTARNTSTTINSGISDTRGTSDATGETETYTTGNTRTKGTGSADSIHRRPLLEPDEVGRQFARVDDKAHPWYPGLALVIASGADPMIVRRVNYFEDPFFIDCFSPHPEEGITRAIGYHPPFSDEELKEATQGVYRCRLPDVGPWLLTPGQVVSPGDVLVTVGGFFPDDRRVPIFMRYCGKLADDGMTVKNYPGVSQDHGIDPFAEIRTLPRRKPIQAEAQPETAQDSYGNTGGGDYGSLLWDRFAITGRTGLIVLAVIGLALFLARGLIWHFVVLHYFIAALIAAVIVGVAVFAVRAAIDVLVKTRRALKPPPPG